MGREFIRIYQTKIVMIPEILMKMKRKTYVTTLKKLEAHFKERAPVVLERHTFFIVALRGLPATCDFGPLTGSFIRDHLVRCNNDHMVQEKTFNPKS